MLKLISDLPGTFSIARFLIFISVVVVVIDYLTKLNKT